MSELEQTLGVLSDFTVFHKEAWREMILSESLIVKLLYCSKQTEDDNNDNNNRDVGCFSVVSNPVLLLKISKYVYIKELKPRLMFHWSTCAFMWSGPLHLHVSQVLEEAGCKDDWILKTLDLCSGVTGSRFMRWQRGGWEKNIVS